MTGTFLSKTGMTFCVYIFLLGAWNESGKVGFITGCNWYSLLWTLISNLGILKVACQKNPQEDGCGGEGGMIDNIEGEVGSIPPYPTFIPPGPKKLFCPFCQYPGYCCDLHLKDNSNRFSTYVQLTFPITMVSKFFPITDIAT